MSFYATIAGEIRYQERTAFQAAIRLLENEGWLDEDGYLQDEGGARLTDDRPNIDHAERLIGFPCAAYRNLARTLPELFAGGRGQVVWVSTDGCFEGGVMENGEETIFELVEWNRSRDSTPAPDANGDFDEYVTWQEEVQEAFFKANTV